jgi:hypothetical protein
MVELEQDILLNINPIKIMVKFNTKSSTEFKPITYDMLANPELSDVRTPAEYPFFTSTVKYPYDMLYNKDYAYVVTFFFNREVFEKILQKHSTDYADENVLYKSSGTYKDVVDDDEQLNDEIQNTMDLLSDNAEYNVNTMMLLLFPIKFTFDSVYSSTYRQYILGDFNSNLFSFDMKRPLWEGNTCILKVDGKDQVVNNVIWLNDVVNHPVYKEFIIKYNTKLRERTDKTNKVLATLTEKQIELFILLSKLYEPIYEGELDFFAYLDSKLEEETPKFDKSGYRSNTQVLKSQTIANMRKQLKPFLKEKGKKTEIVTETEDENEEEKEKNVTNSIVGKIVEEAKNGNKLSMRKIKEILLRDSDKSILRKIVDNISRMYNAMYEYNKTEYKIVLDSELNRGLSKLYESSIAIKSVKLVYDFVSGAVRQLDMDERNKDETDKSKEEKDIIRYISKNLAPYAKLSDVIATTINNVVAPTRDTSNFLLRNEINKIKYGNVNSTDNMGPIMDCTAQTDFFRDAYLKYIRNKSYIPFNESLMFTGVNTVSESESSDKISNALNEIYVLIDVVDKEKYDTKEHRCRLKDDGLLNEMNYLVDTKSQFVVNPFRTNSSYLSAFETSKTDTKKTSLVQNPELVGGKRKTQKRRKPNRKTRSRKN